MAHLVPLTSEALKQAAALYARSPRQFVLMQAVLDGSQPGLVLGDVPSAPSVIVVVNKFGFMHVAGAIDPASSEKILDAISGRTELAQRYLLWYDPPPACNDGLKDRPVKNLRTRQRVRLLHPGSVPKTGSGAQDASSHVRVAVLDQDNLADCVVFGLDLGSRFWPSAAELLARGHGILVYWEGEPAALCYTVAVHHPLAEVDIMTIERFRGKGLAQVATEVFIAITRARGMTAVWDCFDYNEASLRLAQRTGFVETFRYPFVTFNT